jgi:hypothetical protein
MWSIFFILKDIKDIKIIFFHRNLIKNQCQFIFIRIVYIRKQKKKIFKLRAKPRKITINDCYLTQTTIRREVKWI